MYGETQITYWINSKFWGKGIVTYALTTFLQSVNKRPIWGRVAYDNKGSQRVLEKAGFILFGKDRYFANARNMEIEELIYRLDALL